LRSSRPEAIRRGFNNTLTKPVRRRELNRLLNALMAGGAATEAEPASPRFGYGPPSTEEAAAAGILILIAEDNPTNRTVMAKLMARLGYAIEMVESGIEARERLKQPGYGLLITDCHMPDMDGYQLTASLRAEEAGSERRLPIIALTADALPGTAQRCLDAGMDDYLSKPVSIDRLDAAVRRWLPEATKRRREGGMAMEATALVRHGADGAVICDLTEVADLFGGIGDEVVGLIDQFLANVDQAALDLEAAMARGEGEAARHIAHRAAGGAHSIGAGQLGRVWSAVEVRLAGGDLEGARTEAAALTPAIARMVDFARSIGSSYRGFRSAP
jgi:CheY-like chemotaxis protein